jgi:hypothetical protein
MSARMVTKRSPMNVLKALSFGACLILLLVPVVLSNDPKIEEIKLTGEETYVLKVQDGKVIGGSAQGMFSWDVIGGLFDGEHLTFIQKRRSSDRGLPRVEEQIWLTLHLKINGDTAIGITKMDNTGKAEPFLKKYRRE